jgi:predicted DNA-binding transcriptional regulator AlpA
MSHPTQHNAPEKPSEAPRVPSDLPTLAQAEPALLWRLDTVAKSLGIGRRTLERMRTAGQFPPPDVMIGRSPRWRPETIRRWVERGGA